MEAGELLRALMAARCTLLVGTDLRLYVQAQAGPDGRETLSRYADEIRRNADMLTLLVLGHASISRN